MPSPSDDSPVHTLVVKLHHRPGAFDRLVGVLRRQGCVVTTLAFEPSGEPGLDDVTVAFRSEHAERVVKQAQRLVDVVDVAAFTR